GMSRESVKNLDHDFLLYDFDVLSGSAGFEHRFGQAWSASWRAGAVNYDPRRAGSIESTTRFRGLASVEWLGSSTQVTLGGASGPFIQRGFGASTQFRIFNESRASASVRHAFGHVAAMANGAFTHYNDGNDVYSGGAGLSWESGERAVALRYA